MGCDCQNFGCSCATVNIKAGEGILKVPTEHYETFWNKLVNNEEAPPIYVGGEEQKLIYDKKMNTIYYMEYRHTGLKKKKKVRHYLIPE